MLCEGEWTREENGMQGEVRERGVEIDALDE